MQLFNAIALAALSGVAHAAKQGADVFIFGRQSDSSQPAQLPREVARHILLQRTSPSRYGSDLRDLPRSIDTETAVDLIARYGKGPQPLFASDGAQSSATEPAQLVVILEGVDNKASTQLKDAFSQAGHDVTFTISDPPSATANKRLIALFQNMGIASQNQCDFASAINPFDNGCWTGTSSVVKYDVSKSPATLSSILANTPRLSKFAASGSLEATILLLPSSSRHSSLSHWSPALDSLHPRSVSAETVITSSSLLSANSKTPSPLTKPTPQQPKNKIPHCFPSLETCNNATSSCSGHGVCVNKYDAGDSAKCFSCSCKATVLKPGEGAQQKGRQTQHWGGNMCQKEDVAVQFWLIAGFTVTIVLAVGFAVGLLFSVGEEKLPGVIGAGVSRSK